MSNNLNNEKFLEIIKSILTENEIYQGPVNLKSHLKNDLQLDSMGFLTLAQALSDYFKKDLNEAFISAEINTIADIISCVKLELV
jgi:acyl carrier protein